MQTTGEGLYDVWKKLTGNVPGEKDLKNLYDKHGTARILGITVGREEVQKAVQFMMNLVSQGKFEDAKKYYNYDKLFHLFIIIKLSDGYSFKYEKNPSPTVSVPTIPPKAQTLNIPISGNITLDIFLKKAIAKMAHRFFVYDAFSSNCQYFIENLLSANGLLSPAAKEFIQQDVSILTKELPSYVPNSSKLVTDLGAIWQGITGHGIDSTIMKNISNSNIKNMSHPLRDDDYELNLAKLKHLEKADIRKKHVPKMPDDGLTYAKLRHLEPAKVPAHRNVNKHSLESAREVVRAELKDLPLEGMGLSDMIKALKKGGEVAAMNVPGNLGLTDDPTKGYYATAYVDKYGVLHKAPNWKSGRGRGRPKKGGELDDDFMGEGLYLPGEKPNITPSKSNALMALMSENNKLKEEIEKLKAGKGMRKNAKGLYR